MRKAASWIVVALLLMFSLSGCSSSREEITLSMYHWDFELDKDSPIYTEIGRKGGVDITALSAPWSEWPSKLNVMIASGEVPDIFITYGPGDPDSFERLVNYGLLLPLSPYLDRLGLKAPTTVEELYRIARAFKQELGIFPISSSPPHTAGFFWLNYLFYAFGGGWDTWIEKEDGSYLMCWVSDGNRQALRFINRLYREGLLDPEFFSNTDSQKMDRFLSGKSGIVFHNSISM